jgi:hypothetical protein
MRRNDSAIPDSRLMDASLTMKDIPESERPYEKAESKGVRTLTNAELIAVLLTTGRHNGQYQEKYTKGRHKHSDNGK